MKKDPTAFRDRFNRWKEGKPITDIYDRGLPKYDEGSPKRKPMLDRVFDERDDKPLLPIWKDMYSRLNFRTSSPENEVLRTAIHGDAYFDAGTLPEITIYPPKDNAVYKAKYMVRDKDLRQKFYENIQYNDIDPRLYINRLWELYNKSQKPLIRPTQSKYNIIVPLLEKIKGRKGDKNRANYNVLSNSMYVDPEFVDEDIEAELSHAYQFYGTDTPRSLNWIKQFFTLPGDIKINGRSGYDRVGNNEFVAHSIIEPIFHDYLTNPKTQYQDVYNAIQNIYNDQENFFKPIDKGPFSESTAFVNKTNKNK